MKNLTLLLTVLTLTLALPAYTAQSETMQESQATAQSSSGDVSISVNGLVCDFCARALEKVFSKENAVKDIDVNLDTKIITINFNADQTLSDERLTELVINAGYNVEKIDHAK